jgi:hypothetical protein
MTEDEGKQREVVDVEDAMRWCLTPPSSSRRPWLPQHKEEGGDLGNLGTWRVAAATGQKKRGDGRGEIALGGGMARGGRGGGA